MPRTTTLECPGCPSLRALTFDALGLIKGECFFLHPFIRWSELAIPFCKKLVFWVLYALFCIYISGYLMLCLVHVFFFWITVIEAKGSQGGAPRVVERWGELDSSKCVLAASINVCKDDLVCVRCCKLFEFIEFWIFNHLCHCWQYVSIFFKCLVLVPIVSLVWFVEVWSVWEWRYAFMFYGLNVE